MASPSYREPVKQRVRTELLTHAVATLTKYRSRSTVVQPREVEAVIEYATSRPLKASMTRPLRKAIEAEYEQWLGVYQSRTPSKRPEDLKVLYLCGPEPLNDVRVLLEAGVNPHNIWGVESVREEFRLAAESLRTSRIPVKIHPGSLAEFFEVFHERFDIIYVDGCGPFAKRDTLQPLFNVLLHERLESLGVLITNYSQVPSENLDRYAKIISSYFRYRYNDFPRVGVEAGLDPALLAGDDGPLIEQIRQHPGEYYSEFITEFVVDLAWFLVPNIRALCTKDVANSYFAGSISKAMPGLHKMPSGATNLKEFYAGLGDAVLNPSSYPLLAFLRSLEYRLPKDPLVEMLRTSKHNGRSYSDLLAAASLLNAVIEGHWESISPELKTAIQVSWFDAASPFTCDVPFPHLLVNALLGVYGHPYLPNPRRSQRLRYTAKKQEMYCDLFVFDQCRYFFDWFPTVHSAPWRFESIPFQIVARCIIDRLGWHAWGFESHPFHASAVAGMKEIPEAQPYRFEPRRRVGRRAL